MPTIADQVATMEHDHAAALVLIDQLNAANDALASANASLQRDNVALQLEVNDMKHYVDDVRAMAEQLAGSAYEMLRASRRQVGTPAEVIPFAPKPKTTGAVFVEALTAAGASLDAKVAALPEQWPAGAKITSYMPFEYATDSGDENDADRHMTAAEIAMLEEQDASNANALSSQAAECYDKALDELRRTDDNGKVTPLPPHAGPMLVVHEGDLPIFLKRDTAYSPERAIFG